MLAGVHPACFELFARESIRSVVDLKGKTVGVTDTVWTFPPSASKRTGVCSGNAIIRTGTGTITSWT